MNDKVHEMKRLSHYFLFTLLLFFLIIPSGCEREESWESFDCATCYQDKPEMGPLQITVTINGQNSSVPLVVFRGDIEDNNVERIDTAYNTDFTIDVPVEKYYSVKAEYRDGNNTIFAVDGDKLKLKTNSTDCDEQCYYFRGGYIDVRLMKK